MRTGWRWVSAAALLASLAGCGDDGGDDPPASTTTKATTTTAAETTTTSTTTTTLPAEAAEVMPTTLAANEAVFAGGSLWVSGTEAADETGSDTLLRLDPATLEVMSRIDLGGAPHRIVPVGDVLWVGIVGGVARVDMATEQVELVKAEGVVREVAASESAVWFTTDVPAPRVDLRAIDPETLEVRDLNLSDSTASIGAGAMVADGDTVWIASNSFPTEGVLAVDATTDAPIEGFADEFEAANLSPVELLLVDGELWGCAVDLTCLVVDAETGEVVREVVLGRSEEGERPRELRELTVGEGSLWLARSDGQENPDSQYDTSTVVERFDLATGALVGPVYETASPPRRVVVGEGVVLLLSSANESREPRELVRITLP